MAQARDFSDFLAPQKPSRARRAANTDHVTRHLETMFRANMIMRVALPGVLCLGMAGQLWAGLQAQVESSFDSQGLTQITAALGPGAGYDSADEGEPDLGRLFAHLASN